MCLKLAHIPRGGNGLIGGRRREGRPGLGRRRTLLGIDERLGSAPQEGGTDHSRDRGGAHGPGSAHV